MDHTNADLIRAFPEALRQDALRVVSSFPEPSSTSERFSVRLRMETVLIPERIYHDLALIDSTPLTPVQVELLDGLLTRHHNGFVREEHLAKIVGSNRSWIPAFVIRLVGEYVIEILHLIRNNLQNFDPQLYRTFLADNPDFYAITKQRVVSYWYCYYRQLRREDYPGFQILKYFESLVAASN